MSRLRSQINSITLESGQPDFTASEDGRSPSPQPAYATQKKQLQVSQSQNNLQNIQSSLNAIADKVNNLKQPKPKAMEHARTLENKSHQLEDELQRISNGIDTLQNGSGVHSDYLNQMHAELQSLKVGLSKVGSRPSHNIDMPSITRSIEAGYADIASRLDQFLQESTNSAAAQNYDQQFNILNNRIEDISSAVSQINNSSENFADVDAFHRLEARVLSVSDTVEQLLQLESTKAPAGAMELSPSAFEPIAAQIERLSQKIDNIPSMGDVGNNIVSDFEGVLQRLDTLQTDFNMLTTHLAENEETSNASANDEATGIVLIEQRIGELAHKIDQMSLASENAGSDGLDSQEILPVLRDLVSKVDGIQSAPVQAATIDMSSFEAQLSSIASQLGSVSNGSIADMQPINDRLDNIENQIASSRDIVIDMASQAAQKAAVASDVANNTANDEGQLDEITNALSLIAQRLSSIEENSYSSQNNTIASGLVATPSGEAGEEIGGTPLLQGESDATDTVDTAVNYGEISNAPSIDASITDTNFEDVSIDDSSIENSSVLEPNADAYTSENVSENSTPVEDVPLEPGSGMPDIEALVRRATQRKKQENSQANTKNTDASSDLVAAARRAAQAASLEAQSNNGDGNSEKKSKLSRFLKRDKKAKAKTADVNSPETMSGTDSAEDAGQNSGKAKQFMMASVAAIALGFVAYTVVPKFLNANSTPAAVETAALSNSSQKDILEETPEVIASNIPEVEGALEAPTDLAARDMMRPENTVNTAGAGFDASDKNIGALTDIAKNDIANEVATPNAQLPVTDLPTTKAPVETAIAGPVPPKEVGNKALIEAATKGDLNAIFEVGHRYSDGIGVKRSFKDAAKWYELAASRGHALSQYRIGNFYEKGHGVKADPEKAAIWYEQAANQGNALAMHNLAVLNAQGVIGTEPNMIRAVELFEKAADLGVKDSQVNLGIMYTQGMGADKNLEAAYKWFAIANRAGDQDAGKKRDIVGNAMRPEQLQQARAQAEGWKPQKINMVVNTATANPAWTNGENTEKISKKDIIRKTQSLLTRAGFDPGPADGLFGLKTRDAIISFQKRTGLKQNGEISPELLQALSKVST